MPVWQARRWRPDGCAYEADMRSGGWALLVIAGLCLASCAGEQRLARPWTAKPAVAEDPAVARVDEARRLLDAGLVDQAQPIVEELLAAGHPHPLLPYLRAQLAERAQDWDGCMHWARRAVAANPAWGEPRVLLARACLAAGRIGDADAAFADVERLLPDSPWGPYGRAWVAAQRLELARAGELADEALRRDPGHAPSWQLRAQVAKLRGETAREEQCWQRLLTLLAEPDPAIFVRLAELAEGAGRRAEARRAYERAWELRPARDIARRLAELAHLEGDEAQAARWRERAR
ncbi:MAG: hypothetical protein NZ552_04475 [Planctomycetes bacterium]|nr:hypothetical protein [Planctomycetota bacterium]